MSSLTDLWRQAQAQHLTSEKDTRPYWETQHRGMVLPLVQSGYNNSVSYGIPGVLGGQGWQTMNDIVHGRSVTPDEIGNAAGDVAGAAMTGSFAFGRPRGSIGSGGGREQTLPMDQASRMARAKEMGFDVDKQMYHGTAASFDEFSLSHGGTTSGSRAGSMGVSVSPAPDVAAEFAGLASRPSGDGSRILPLFVRPGRQGRLALDGTERNFEVAATLADAWDAGFDSVLLKNYTTPGGNTAQNVVVLKNPKDVRSVNADFNPAMSNSANLLAANAPTSAAAPSLQSLADEYYRNQRAGGLQK